MPSHQDVQKDVQNSMAKAYTPPRDLISTIWREEFSWDNHALQQSSRLWFRWTLEPTTGVPAGGRGTNRFVMGHMKGPGLNQLSLPWRKRKRWRCASASTQRPRRSAMGRTRRSEHDRRYMSAAMAHLATVSVQLEVAVGR